MKNLLLGSLIAIAVLMTACSTDSGVNQPTTTSNSNEYSSVMKLADELNLTNDQMAVVDEMFYLDEDMSVVLDGRQMVVFNNMINGLNPDGRGDMRDRRGGIDRRHMVVDLSAIMYYNLIVRANPDLGSEILTQLRELIAQYNKERMELIQQYKDDPETLRQLLQEKHDALIAAMNALIGAEAVANVEALKAEIEKRREEQRQKMLERRIEAQVKFYTHLLGLDAAQQASLKDILTQHHATVEALRVQYAGDPEGFRAALKAEMDALNAAIAGILTPEQLIKWENYLKRLKGPRG